MPTEQLHYGPTAKAFHWAIAALIAIQVPLGWLMPGIRRGLSPGTAMTAHVSIGMTILLVIGPRFVWRLAHPVAPETNLAAWQRISSELMHWLLYLVVLLTTGGVGTSLHLPGPGHVSHAAGGASALKRGVTRACDSMLLDWSGPVTSAARHEAPQTRGITARRPWAAPG